MAYWFGDSFDLYAAITDCGTYWDATFGGGGATLGLASPGRFTGSRGIGVVATSATPYISKTSGVNDGVHHISLAFQQAVALTGASNGVFISLFDGAAVQCSIIFRSDGAIVLTNGGVSGTALATYTGAVAAVSTWYQFEIEIVIHNTAGSIAVRKLGNTVNDFFLGSLNTRNGSANAYANKLTIGNNFSTSANGQIFDDFLWRSDASSLAWLGDIRCYTRMPASDASVAWSHSGAVAPVTPCAANANANHTTAARYGSFVASYTGTIATATMTVGAALTANIKAAIFASSGGVPTTVLATSTPVANPGVGTLTFTFPTPANVTQGATYFFGTIQDVSSGTLAQNNLQVGLGQTVYSSTALAYAAWPAANPASLSPQTQVWIFTVNITPGAGANAPMVCEAMQDGAVSYNYSSTVGQSDLYNLGSLSATPGSIIGVTTRAYLQKSDAGTRIAAVQLQSGASNNQTPLTLNTTWAWAFRNDLVDPATGVAWTATAVNNAQIGCVVTA